MLMLMLDTECRDADGWGAMSMLGFCWNAGVLGCWAAGMQVQRPTMGDRRKIRGRCGVQVQVQVQAGIGAVGSGQGHTGE